MSDPAKNVEIEDVLASIRRLVSDEVTQELAARKVTPQAKPQAAPPRDPEPMVAEERSDMAQRAETPAVDALVLTPALRVHDGGRDQDLGESQTVAEDPAGETVAEPISEPVSHQEELDGEEHEALLQAVAEHLERSQDEPELSVEADSVAPDFEESQDAAEALDTDQAPEAEQTDELATGETAPSEPFVLTPDDQVADETGAADAAVEEAVAPEVTLEDKIARLETMIGSQAGEWEAEAETGPEPVQLDWEDVSSEPVSEAEPIVLDAEPVDQEIAIAPDEQADIAASAAPPSESAEAVIDEDMLRDIVTSIIREELQGALGERITRNVRKLVRREIHRALASQELD